MEKLCSCTHYNIINKCKATVNINSFAGSDIFSSACQDVRQKNNQQGQTRWGRIQPGKRRGLCANPHPSHEHVSPFRLYFFTLHTLACVHEVEKLSLTRTARRSMYHACTRQDHFRLFPSILLQVRPGGRAQQQQPTTTRGLSAFSDNRAIIAHTNQHCNALLSKKDMHENGQHGVCTLPRLQL